MINVFYFDSGLWNVKTEILIFIKKAAIIFAFP